MTSGENQTKPAAVSAVGHQLDQDRQTKASARRVPQEDLPAMTAVAAKRSPQYVSGGEDEDGAVLLRSGSPMRCVSEFDEVASSTKEENGEELSTTVDNIPVLPNPLHNAKLRSNHVAALRLEAELHPMRMILGRLMVHTSNKKGLFNVPVDATALGLVDYHQVIQKPMDLGTVKARLYSIA